VAEEAEGEEAQEGDQAQEARRRASPSAEIVYEAVRAEGLEELERSTAALAWSGIAAGLSMGFSMVAQGLLKARLPDTAWAPLLVRFGYPVGFLVVVLGRQQLFTENTLTPIIPYLAGRSHQHHARPVAVANILRLWGVVLAANLIGAFAFAVVVAKTDVFSEPPTLAGNVIGGVMLTAALNHAQVVAGSHQGQDPAT
jgi:formate-nitrite transporter family protein